LLPAVSRSSTRGQVVPPANDQVREYRTGYLLLEVLKAPQHTLADADAAEHLDTYAREGLELNASTARHLWRDLAAQGLLAASGAGRAVRYTITPAGRVKLANADFPPGRKFSLTGQTLNALLEAAREVGKQFSPAPGEPAGRPARDELERAVLAAFEELHRERHAVTGLIPIHEVRAAVRDRLGAAAARHDVFDGAVRDLRRTGRLRLVPITDQSRASAGQLQDAIPGTGEVLFFMETAHEPAAR
jgi:hypothetical protein